MDILLLIVHWLILILGMSAVMFFFFIMFENFININKILFQWHTSKEGEFYIPKINQFGKVDSNKNIVYYQKTYDLLYLPANAVMYLEQDYNHNFNQYIDKYYKSICYMFEAKNYNFIYLPKLVSTIDFSGSIAFLKHKYPLLHHFSDDMLLQLCKNECSQTNMKDLYGLIIGRMGLRNHPKPIFVFNYEIDIFYYGFLRNYLQPITGEKEWYCRFPVRKKNLKVKNLKFGFYEINKNKEKQFIIEIGNFLIHNVIQDRLRFKNSKLSSDEDIVKRNAESDPDYKFYEEYENDKKFIDDMENFLAYNPSYIVADALMGKIFSKISHYPALMPKIGTFIEKRKHYSLEDNIFLSPITITKNNRLLLKDYNNLEIVLDDLPKAIYLLFLKHPEGILIKDFEKYKTELHDIYQNMSEKTPSDQELEIFNNLFLLKTRTLNFKCHTIRKTILRLVGVIHAKYYIINGSQGKPFKIQLPKKFVSFEA